MLSRTFLRSRYVGYGSPRYKRSHNLLKYFYRTQRSGSSICCNVSCQTRPSYQDACLPFFLLSNFNGGGGTRINESVKIRTRMELILVCRISVCEIDYVLEVIAQYDTGKICLRISAFNLSPPSWRRCIYKYYICTNEELSFFGIGA
jgi:hypothetical protein